MCLEEQSVAKYDKLVKNRFNYVYKDETCQCLTLQGAFQDFSDKLQNDD